MIYIEKQPCPPDIKAKLTSITSQKGFRSLPEVNAGKSTNKTLRDYFNKINKPRVREALLEEQHGLCAYCMSKISNDGKVTTIEHFLPLSKYKSRALDYSNYMAVCNGGRNATPKQGRKKIQCCDASKANIEIELTPHKADMVAGLAYDDRGRIYADYQSEDRTEKNLKIQEEIDKVLVLNGVVIDRRFCDTSTNLVKKRKDAYRRVDEVLMEGISNGSITVEMLDSKIARLQDPSKEQWDEMVGVDLYLYKSYRQRLLDKMK